MRFEDLSIKQRVKIREILHQHSQLWAHRIVINYCDKYGEDYTIEQLEENRIGNKSISLYNKFSAEFLIEEYELLKKVFEVITDDKNGIENNDINDSDLPF
jgi:hypothetical protein